MKRLIFILFACVFVISCGTTTIDYGRDKYTGELKDGRPHGQGTAISDYGYKYVGEWKNGQRHGQGTITYSSGPRGGEKYVGQWKNGQPHGQGMLTKPDGRKFIGKFKNGKPFPQGFDVFSYEGWLNNCSPRFTRLNPSEGGRDHFIYESDSMTNPTEVLDCLIGKDRSIQVSYLIPSPIGNTYTSILSTVEKEVPKADGVALTATDTVVVVSAPKTDTGLKAITPLPDGSVLISTHNWTNVKSFLLTANRDAYRYVGRGRGRLISVDPIILRFNWRKVYFPMSTPGGWGARYIDVLSNDRGNILDVIPPPDGRGCLPKKIFPVLDLSRVMRAEICFR